MLRRRLVCATTASATLGSLASSVTTVRCAARFVTSRGQFNPIHDFSAGVADPNRRAQSEKEFEKMITNPGPIRVGYSADYLDWLYRAYSSKMKYADMRAKAEKVFSGALFTQQQQPTHNTNSAHGGAALSDREREAIATLPGAPPPGHFLRPHHSSRRMSGEHKRAEAQATLDKVAQAQGMLDLLERQPQFPAIHIEKASRFHLVELFKELVLDRALEPREVWDKALLYRAILSERKASYPPSFRYIFESVEDTVLAPPTADSGLAGAETPAMAAGSGDLNTRCPSEDDYLYFLFLVKRYYVDNGVEGHVVLRCHRAPNAQELLFSSPPPKDENEVKRAIFAERKADPATTDSDTAAPGAAANTKRTIRAPSQYPPIEALWRCEENLPLLKVLVFGELNLLVSENPFAKFPNAQAFITRPNAAATAATGTSTASGQGGNQSQGNLSTGGRGGTRQSQAGGGGQRRGQRDAVSLASVIGERRGHLVAPLPRHVATAIDARANDLHRLQQRHQREDAAGFHQKVLRGPTAESSPVTFSSYSDWAYFNPRAVRAEAREGLHREAVEALKVYDRASQDIYRTGYEKIELDSTVRPTEQSSVFPTYVPTLAHFAAQVYKDKHISFLRHVVLPSSGAGAAHTETAPSKADELNRLVLQLARALHNTALEYNKETLRRVNHQKVLVAAALLDNFVKAEWKAMLSHGERAEASDVASVSAMARRFSAYAPFEHRALDEAGFTTDAREADYQRWMRAPTAEATAH